MNWKEIDNIKRENKSRFKHKEMKRVPDSVKHIANTVDLRVRAGFAITESDFHQMDSPVMDTSKDSHIEATLAKVSRWQSFSRADSR